MAQSGVLEAGSAASVVSQLRARGWMVTGVREKEAKRFELRFPTWLPFMGPRSIHVELSLPHIALLLRGGLTLLPSPHTVAEHSSRAALRAVWRRVIDDLHEGSNFSDALAQHNCFPTFVVRLARVGEQTGVLESVLVRSANMLRARREAKRDMLTALTYPTIVTIAATGVAAYMVGYLIPKLANLLESLGKQLPAMTMLLVDISKFIEAYGITILIGIVISIAVAWIFYRSPFGRLWTDRLALRVPILGRILRVAATNTFAQGMGTLLRSGITVLEAMVTVEQMHYNRYLAVSLQEARESVMQGRTLADALREHRGYTPLLFTMTAVGEESGNLDEVMDEVAMFHETQFKAIIRQLSAWVTPAVIVVVGGIVGFVYIAFFMALFAVGA